MPGPNLTGTPNTSDYNLGRGRLYISALDANGLPGAWRDFGNVSEFNINIATETLEHRSSREGLQTIDKEVTVSQDLEVSFTADEINDENLADFFAGAKSVAATNPAIGGIANIDPYITSVELGKWYDIQDAAIPTLSPVPARAYDIDTANLLLEETTPVTLVEDTDYTVDLKNGRFFLKSTASNIAAGDDLELTLTADAGALQPDEVRALTQTQVQVALKFIMVNPANSDFESEYQFHQVQLKADGDFALIGTDWTTMGFTASAEKNEAASPDSPTLTIRTHANG